MRVFIETAEFYYYGIKIF